MDSLKGDPRPFYLGYDKESNSYFVYAMKDGTPRFLKYISYWHWAKSPDSILVLSPIPEEIESELVAFLSGKIHYEFFSKRKNSREQSVRKTYRTFDCDGLEPGNESVISSGPNENPPPLQGKPGVPAADGDRRHPRRNSRRSSNGDASVKTNDVISTPSDRGTESRQHGRSKSSESVRSGTSVTPDNTTSDKQNLVHVKIRTKSVEPAFKRSRGRSASVLENQTEAPSSGSGSLRDLHEDVPKPRRGRIPKSK